MGRRMMQWNNNNTTKGSILIAVALLLLLPVVVGGVRLELVHRHHERFSKGRELDRAAAVEGFVRRDGQRRQEINRRWGIDNDHENKKKRRRATEVAEPAEVQMQMHGGRDQGLGEYFVEIKVGTPGQPFWLAADTGSEFTWVNCITKNVSSGSHRKTKKKTKKTKKKTKKKHHHKKNKTRRKRKSKSSKKSSDSCKGVFCPHKSKTFQTVTCDSSHCKDDLGELFSLNVCPKPSDPCLYDFSYADGSSARGFFGTETITVDLINGKKGKLNNLTIGCTKSMLNGVNFNEDTGGILGLGFARDSFIDKAAFKYGAKFSYCLVDHLSHRNVSSYLTIGGNHSSKLLGEIKRTELVMLPPFYGVNVVGISIGGQMLKIPPQVWDFDAQGGTLIDSGTTLTALLHPAYDSVFDALTKSITKVKRVLSDDYGSLDFCFEAEGFDDSIVPRLVFHFAGGARFEPPVKSYIIDVAPGVKCIGIVPIESPSGASVIGNIMQQNHLWEFDLTTNSVGFAPSICT